jgi:hypothetical protein
MQTNPRHPRLRAPLPLFPNEPRRALESARRHFVVELECDGIPYRHNSASATSTEATHRARGAFSQQEGVSYARMRVVSCVELGPA